MSELSVGVLGLGEAGSRLARDLTAAGARVCAWDLAPRPGLAGVRMAGGPTQAVAGARLVLSLTTAEAALDAARSVRDALAPGVLYADLNTAAPALKRELAELLGAAGAFFADVALMAPVPRAGLATPSLASGPGAEAFAALLRPLGMPVEVVPGPAGAAAARKLLRSVFTKGLAAAVDESLQAAAALGCRDWLFEEVANELARADRGHLDRVVEGSRLHAGRRVEEMRAAAELLRELGLEPDVSLAAQRRLERLAAGANPGGRPEQG